VVHYYQFIPSIGIPWTGKAHINSLYYGLQGCQLPLSADEQDQDGLEEVMQHWEVWKWVTGPEGLANGGTGTTFWNGLANGSTTPPYNFCLMEYRRAKSIQWSPRKLRSHYRTWCWYYRVLE
jgi:hypothetical protein